MCVQLPFIGEESVSVIFKNLPFIYTLSSALFTVFPESVI